MTTDSFPKTSCLRRRQFCRQSTSASINASCPNKRVVTFGSIAIEEFPTALGDSVPRKGAPIALGNKATRSLSISLEEFERIRPRRRGRGKLVIDKDTRDIMLLDAGYSIEDILNATESASRIQAARDDAIKEAHNSKFRVIKLADVTRRAFMKIINPIKNSSFTARSA